VTCLRQSAISFQQDKNNFPSSASGGRDSSAELRQFLRQAGGPASELEYQLLLAHDLGLLRNREWQVLSAETVDIRRMLSALIKRLGVLVSPKPQKTTK
jgi:hypothetical protein